MTYKCEMVENQGQPALSIRTRIPVEKISEVFEKAYGSIWAYMDQMGVKMEGVPYAAYYNMDMKDLDIEVGIPVSKPVEGNDVIQASQIPSGLMAVTVHQGPYSQVEPAYHALMTFIQEKGYNYAGVGYEFYLNEPGTVPESELKTRIMFTVKK